MIVGYTISEIAKRLRQPVHRVKYAVRTRGIRPAQRIARVLVFTEGQIPVIQAAIESIGRDRRPRTRLRQ